MIGKNAVGPLELADGLLEEFHHPCIVNQVQKSLAPVSGIILIDNFVAGENSGLPHDHIRRGRVGPQIFLVPVGSKGLPFNFPR